MARDSEGRAGGVANCYSYSPYDSYSPRALRGRPIERARRRINLLLPARAARPKVWRAAYCSGRHLGQARGFRSHFSTNSPLDTSSDIETSCRSTA